jgi:hypothetical protein
MQTIEHALTANTLYGRSSASSSGKVSLHVYKGQLPLRKIRRIPIR